MAMIVGMDGRACGFGLSELRPREKRHRAASLSI
jgi:hypothetical protein